MRAADARLDAAEVARLAEAGDRDAKAAIARFEQRLAVALAGIINILDPDVIVLGGGLASIASIYARVPALWRGLCVAPEPRTRLVPARFGPESGLRGAAWLGAIGLARSLLACAARPMRLWRAGHPGGALATRKERGDEA